MEKNKLHGYILHALRFAKALIKWIVLGTMVGIAVGFVAAAFGHVLGFANGLRGEYPLIRLGLPIGGLVIVFLYRYFN